MNVVDILNYNIGFRFRFSICLYFGGSLIEVIIEIISIVNIRLSTFWSRDLRGHCFSQKEKKNTTTLRRHEINTTHN